MNAFRHELDWMYSFSDLERKRSRDLAKNVMKPEKAAHLLRELGDPQAGQNIVHIAGSKGKGSVAFLLANWFRSRGVRTGLYTSPHLFDVRERILLDGEPIPEADFIGLARELRAVVEAIPAGRAAELEPTFFDLFTAMAFAWFRRRGAEAWIVETGLGGRLDSTNVVTPLASVITSISKEHTEVLGRRLRQIAWEKGGIIKPGVPVVVAGNRPEVLGVLREMARERGSPLYLLPERLACRPAGYRREADGRILQKVRVDGRTLETSLLGLYQVENIGLFLLTLRVLRFRTGGLPVGADPGAADGLDFLRRLEWPGRLTHRQAGEAEFWVDGAHNAESARYLARSLRALRRAGVADGRPLVGIVGMFSEKDHAGILRAVLPLLDAVTFIEPDPWRDCRVEHYLPVFHRLNGRGIPWSVLGPVADDPAWLQRVLAESRRRFGGPFGVLATGSLYTAARVLRALDDRQETAWNT